MSGKSNKHQEVSDAFINEAWDKMAKVLDEEMPTQEEKPNRKLVVWWWLGGLISLGILSLLVWNTLLDNSLPTIPDTKKKDTLEAIQEPIIAQSTTQISKEKLVNTSSNKKIASELITQKVHKKVVLPVDEKRGDSNEVKAKAYSDFLHTAKTKKTNQFPLSRSVHTDNTTRVLGNTSMTKKVNVVTAKNDGLNNNGGEAINAVVEESLLSSQHLPISVVPNLPLKLSSLKKNIDNEPALSILKTIPEAPKWHFSLAASNLIVNKWSNGFEFGGMVERSLGQKWSLQTGLKYQYRNADIGYKDATRLKLVEIPVDLSSYVTYDTITVKYTSRTIRQLNENNHVVVLPLNVFYRPMTKLHFWTGLDLQLRANAKSLDYLEAFAFSVSDLSEESENMRMGSLANSGNSRLSVYTQIGIGFFPKEKTGITFQFNTLGYYNKSFYNPLKNKYFHNYWQLGVRHYLGKRS